MITINGQSFDVDVLCDDLTQTFEKLSDENSGRLQGSGDMYIKNIGTFYNYELHIKRRVSCSASDYDRLWTLISAPTEFYTITMPHNQTEITLQAYITSGSRKLMRSQNGTNYWGDFIIKFISKSVYMRA